MRDQLFAVPPLREAGVLASRAPLAGASALLPPIERSLTEPGVGSVLAAGPFLGALVTGLESAAMVGGVSAIAVGLIRLGNSEGKGNRVRECDHRRQIPSDCEWCA